MYEREHKTIVNIGGMMMPMTAYFKITSYGDSGSHFEPPESPEIELVKVIRDSDDKNMTDLLNETYLAPFSFMLVLKHNPNVDPISTVLFQYHGKYSLGLFNNSETALQKIEMEIYETDSYFLDRDDFD